MIKKTQIICTVGPSTDKPGILEAMILAGMNIARFNFSHGSHADHARRIAMVREVAQRYGRHVALLLDTKGPEMRIGKFAQGKINLMEGQKFTITTRDVVGNSEIVSVNHKYLPEEVQAGNIILLSDGLISLRVEAVQTEDVITTALNSGELGDLKRVAVPGVPVKLPFLSKRDIDDLLFGIEYDMDFVAASFVQRAADVIAIRKVLEESNANMEIIAKIESAEGVRNIDEILRVADAIMVARGDLGVEIPTEEVPVVQKLLIEKSNKAGKPVITATQMLESMMLNPRPTRAEASDIANAILDGTDVIMLSGETASGQYPVEAVQMMAKIAIRTEASLSYTTLLQNKGVLPQRTTTDAISHATVHVAHELNAAAILTATEHGYTARMVSKYRPCANVVAVTPNPRTARRMLLLWGVYPVLGESSQNTDEMVSSAMRHALQCGAVSEGDLVVVTAGAPAGMSGTTNMIRVHVIGNVLLKGTGVGQRAFTGQVCIAHSAKEVKNKFRPGDVLVVASIDEETAAYASEAGAIISEEGGLTSHAAIIGVSFGIPVIVGVDGAVKRLTEGLIVTVDSARGLIYQGEINVR